jgi:hypothetical protein
MSALQTTAAAVTKEMGAFLVAAVEAMPADKQTWRPLDEGRDALDQLVELTSLNFVAAEALRTKSNPVFSDAAEAKMKAELDTVPKALAGLQSSCDAVVSALESLSDDELEKTVTLPFRGGIVRPLSWLAFLPIRHMSYHYGQINYIQTLYGDKDMHVPK